MVKRGDGEEFCEGRWFTFWRPDKLGNIAAGAGFEVSSADEVPSQDGRRLTWVRIVGGKPRSPAQGKGPAA